MQLELLDETDGVLCVLDGDAIPWRMGEADGEIIFYTLHIEHDTSLQ